LGRMHTRLGWGEGSSPALYGDATVVSDGLPSVVLRSYLRHPSGPAQSLRAGQAARQGRTGYALVIS
jgi:hypothetical protein